MSMSMHHLRGWKLPRLGDIRISESMKHESRLGRAASENARRRDPRPPSCTGGTKIVRSGEPSSYRNVSSNERSRQARCANLPETLPRDNKGSDGPNKIILGQPVLDQRDHLIGPRDTI